MKKTIIALLLMAFVVLAVSCTKKDTADISENPVTVYSDDTSEPSLQGELDNYENLGDELETNGELEDLDDDLNLDNL